MREKENGMREKENGIREHEKERKLVRRKKMGRKGQLKGNTQFAV